MQADFFVTRDGELTGPFTPSELKRMAREGQITESDLVQKGRDGKPTCASNVKGLFTSVVVKKESEPSATNIAMAKTWHGLSTVTHATGRFVMSIANNLRNRRTVISTVEPQTAILGPIPSQDIAAAPEGDSTDCPFCGETIKRIAKKCKHCGEILDVTMRPHVQPQHSAQPHVMQPVINISNVNTATAVAGNARPAKRWSPLVAMFLSLLIPGLGQLYKGQALNGFVWFCLTVAGYFLIIPGIILHVCCVLGAASGDPYR